MGLKKLTFLGSEHRRKQCGNDENTGPFQNGRNRESARKTKCRLPLVVELWRWLVVIFMEMLVDAIDEFLKDRECSALIF